MKLLDACGQGIPVLATAGGVTGFANLPAGGVFVSEVPDEWRQRLRRDSFSETERAGVLRFASSYSWDNVVSQFIAAAGL